MKILSIKIEEDFLDKVDRYAINHKLYRSDVVRQALAEFLKNHAGDNEDYEARVEKIIL
jgi:metal-responsive CopG/Arc/MetJ family transcriptional regulator